MRMYKKEPIFKRGHVCFVFSADRINLYRRKEETHGSKSKCKESRC